jgi:hypothetical protein
LKRGLIIFGFLLGFISQAFAQRKVSGGDNFLGNMPNFDKQRIHFGFLLGINQSTFRLKLNSAITTFDTVATLSPTSSFGFDLGIISNLRISEYFDLRVIIPQLSFMERQINYMVKDSSGKKLTPLSKIMESNFVYFPVEIKWKSARIKNYRMYLLAGGQYGIDLASNKKQTGKDREDPIKLEKSEKGYYLGFGVDFYLPYAKLSPQIKLYNGLNNTVVQDGRQVTAAITNGYTRALFFSLTFE